MTRTMLAGLFLLGLMSCGKPPVEDAGPAARGLGAGASGTGLPTRPHSRSLPSGATITATTERTITSRSTEDGETVAATIDADVTDEVGWVVLPAGSIVELTVTEITPAKNRSQADGRLTLQVTGITVRDRHYPIAAEVTSVSHTLKGRGVTAGEVEKVAVGTAIGAVAGRVIGGNAKGAIIGGAVGAVGGTVVAIQTASRDVVVAAGTPVTITLTWPLTVATK